MNPNRGIFQKGGFDQLYPPCRVRIKGLDRPVLHQILVPDLTEESLPWRMEKDPAEESGGEGKGGAVIHRWRRVVSLVGHY